VFKEIGFGNSSLHFYSDGLGHVQLQKGKVLLKFSVFRPENQLSSAAPVFFPQFSLENLRLSDACL
jgi:hypothetical protein